MNARIHTVSFIIDGLGAMDELKYQRFYNELASYPWANEMSTIDDDCLIVEFSAPPLRSEEYYLAIIKALYAKALDK